MDIITFDDINFALEDMQFYHMLDIVSDKIPAKILNQLVNGQDPAMLKNLDVSKPRALRVCARREQNDQEVQGQTLV